MHKFKLKKDGKVVGYLKIEKRKKMRRYFSRPDDLIVRYKGCFNRSTWHSQPVIVSSFDTAEPFVCLDKNKNEVYAKDPIRYQGKNYPEGFSWDESSLAWDLHDGYFHTHYGATGTGGEDDYFDIELIKKKEKK